MSTRIREIDAVEMFRMLPATWKCAIIVVIMMFAYGTNQVFAEDQNLGRLRVAGFVCPRQVAPGSVFSVNLDIEYEVRTNATIRGAIFEGIVNASTPLWQSDVASVSGGGDKIWVINFTAPITEGTIQLTAFAYYLENGVWKFYNNTVLGPGFRVVSIKVARAATLQVALGLPGVQLALGNMSETTTGTGSVNVTLPVGVTYPLSVPLVSEYANLTRMVFNGWQDGNNQTSRIISLDGDTKLIGSYRTQYLLRVTSNLSNHSYEKWYDVGANVTLQEVDSVPMLWPLSLLGGKYVFSGWSGDVNSGSIKINFSVNSPTIVHANFSIAYNTLIVFPIVIAVGIMGELVLLTLKRKKTLRFKAESSKSMPACSNCGTSMEGGWVHCLHCGTKIDSLENQPTNDGT